MSLTKIPKIVIESSDLLTKEVISSALDSNSENSLASSKAVKEAYDLANSANTTANNAVAKTSISDAINSNVSTTVASSKAVKTAYDLANNTKTTVDGLLGNNGRILQSKLPEIFEKWKGGYSTSSTLPSTGTEGDYAICYDTDTVWIWDAQKTGGAGWIDTGKKGAVTTVNGKTGEVTITLSDLGITLTTSVINGLSTAVSNAQTTADNAVAKTSISDSTSSNVSTTVASSKAVKAAYDLANTANTNAVHKTGDEEIDGSKTFKKTIVGSVNGSAGSCTGNAATATQLANSRNIELTGDVTGSASFNGTANASIAATLANSGVTAGSAGPTAAVTGSNGATVAIPRITVDAKGRVTELTSYNLTCQNTDTDTHWTTHLYAGASNGNANAATTNGNTYLIVCDNTTARDRRKIAGSGGTSVSSDASGNITISSTELTAADKDIIISTAIAVNGTLTVPSYLVGKGYIQLWYDGVYLPLYNATNAPNGCWQEIGTAGAASTSVKFLIAIPKDTVITARVWTKA